MALDFSIHSNFIHENCVYDSYKLCPHVSNPDLGLSIHNSCIPDKPPVLEARHFHSRQFYSRQALPTLFSSKFIYSQQLDSRHTGLSYTFLNSKLSFMTILFMTSFFHTFSPPNLSRPIHDNCIHDKPLNTFLSKTFSFTTILFTTSFPPHFSHPEKFCPESVATDKKAGISNTAFCFPISFNRSGMLEDTITIFIYLLNIMDG